jgi:hypothetical protein
VQWASPFVSGTDYRVRVKEYYHAEWNHYFMTADVYEQSLLGKPPFEAWQPTGRSFIAYAPCAGTPCVPSPNALPVCRYFNDAFAPKSTHFYGLPGDCNTVATSFPDWQLEKTYAFGAAQVYNSAGICAGNLEARIPIYRYYNNGEGGAPNHRYVQAADAAAMVDQGWVSDPGALHQGAVFCVIEPG